MEYWKWFIVWWNGTCGDVDVDVWQCGQVASPCEESIAHLNKNTDEDKFNTKMSQV